MKIPVAIILIPLFVARGGVVPSGLESCAVPCVALEPEPKFWVAVVGDVGSESVKGTVENEDVKTLLAFSPGYVSFVKLKPALAHASFISTRSKG